MSTWNYRVIKKNESEFGIYEVHYDGNGKVVAWTEESVVPVCTSEKELLQQLTMIREALDKETIS